jgi:hypothetical protein
MHGSLFSLLSPLFFFLFNNLKEEEEEGREHCKKCSSWKNRRSSWNIAG